MNIFSKISAGRQPANKKSVYINGLWFNTTKIITKADADEIMEFVEKNCPEIMGGSFYFLNSFPHLFSGSNNTSNKFMFALSCLRNKDGGSVFNLVVKGAQQAIQATKEDSEVTEVEDDTPAPENLIDTIKSKYNLKEFRKLIGDIKDTGFLKKDIKKMKEAQLVEILLKHKSDEEIKELLLS